MKGTRGMERGRGGVYAPQRRPTVEAAVSAQERLREGKMGQLGDGRYGRVTHIRMETVATSRG